MMVLLQNRPVEGAGAKYCYRMDIPLPGSPCTRFPLPSARKLWLSMSEIGEKERNYLFRKLYRLRVMT